MILSYTIVDFWVPHWNNPQLEPLGVEGSKVPGLLFGFLSFAEPSDLGIQKSPFRIMYWGQYRGWIGCDSNPQSYCRNGTESLGICFLSMDTRCWTDNTHTRTQQKKPIRVLRCPMRRWSGWSKIQWSISSRVGVQRPPMTGKHGIIQKCHWMLAESHDKEGIDKSDPTCSC